MIGMYNGVILRRSENVCPGVNSSTGAAITTVRRAVFLGAQAAVIGFGSDFNPGTGAFKWVNSFGPLAVEAANDNDVNCWNLLAA